MGEPGSTLDMTRFRQATPADLVVGTLVLPYLRRAYEGAEPFTHPETGETVYLYYNPELGDTVPRVYGIIKVKELMGKDSIIDRDGSGSGHKYTSLLVVEDPEAAAHWKLWRKLYRKVEKKNPLPHGGLDADEHGDYLDKLERKTNKKFREEFGNK
jgi:hypothetical protein